MSGGLELIIKPDGFLIVAGRGSLVEKVSADEPDIGEASASFVKKNGLRVGDVNLFLAEELVFLTSLELPSKTTNLGEAIQFQLGMAVPFSEKDILHSYLARREGDIYRVVIAAARAGHIIAAVEKLVRAGFVVKGIYPENQRYVTGKWRKLRWAMVMPGRHAKIFVFEGGRLSDRLLGSGDELQYDELKRICGTENIFHPDPPESGEFKPLDKLLAAPPLLKDFNMLPASYRRLDYLKIAVVALIILNLLGLFGLGGSKFIEQSRLITQADQEIERLQPLVEKVRDTREQIKRTEDFLGLIDKLKANPELFPFLENLTMTLPEGSYLNQLQIDVPKGTAVINGFTDNVGELTEKLQTVGETRLQSTSRRRDMTYFQVEISLP